MTKIITEKYKKLDEISHVLLRPGRYIGSINPHTELGYVYNIDSNKMEQKEITYTPALLKIFDEVVSNSVDFSKTEDGKHVSTVKISVDRITGEISVFDDGGIHVIKHEEHDQWIPEMIFELRSGSNFDDTESDNDYSTGQNGEGAALTSIFSTSFIVETSDGYNKFHQEHVNNSREKTEPKISKSDKHFTKITWMPDYCKFNLEGLDEGNYCSLLKRTVDLAGCNPNLKVYFNNTLLKIKSFEDYIKLYTEDFVFESNVEWKIGISHSTVGFEHLSFVNSTLTKVGGPHVEYIATQITNKLREFFKKKHKVDVKPSDIKNHFSLFIDASIKKPRYSSQTKESLITEVKNFGTSIELSDKFIRNILKSEIIQSILDWVTAKEKATEAAELRKANKNLDKADPKRVEKFHDASTKDRSEAVLLLAEGDCLEEHSELVIQTEDGFISKIIKDVQIGEKVISHTGKIQKITNKQHRLKPTLTLTTNIGNIKCTKEHKIYVYDTIKNDFIFIEAQYLDKSIHKLVKGKFMDYDFVSKIEAIHEINSDPLYNLEFIVCDGDEFKYIKSTLTHRFGCFDFVDNKFVFIEAKNILKNRHAFLYKNKRNC